MFSLSRSFLAALMICSLIFPQATLGATASSSSMRARVSASSRAQARKTLRETRAKKVPVVPSTKSSSSSSKAPAKTSTGMVELGATLMKNNRAIYIAFIERGSPADLGGLKPGDEILKIDDVKTPRNTDLEKVLGMLRGPAGSRVTVEFGRAQQGIKSLTIQRTWASVPTESLVEMRGETLLIVPEDLTEAGVKAIREKITALGSIPAYVVIDLRKNPKGSFEGAMAFIGMFLPKGTHVAWMETKNDPPYTQGMEKIITSVDPLFAKGTRIGVLTHNRTFRMILLIAEALAHRGGKDVQLFTSSTGFAVGQMSAKWTMRDPAGKEREDVPVIFWSLKEERTIIGCSDMTEREWCIGGADEALVQGSISLGDEEKDRAEIIKNIMNK